MTAYSPGLSLYVQFCDTHGASFPPTADMVLAFATFLFAHSSVPFSSVKRHVLALRSICVDVGASIDCFDNPRLSRLYIGMAKSRPPRTAPPPPRRLPITGPILARLLTLAPPSTNLGRALRAASALGFFGLMRAGEIAGKGTNSPILLRQHVTWKQDQLHLLLPHSKTDRLHQGVTLKIFKSSSAICPYDLLRAAWVSAPRQAPTDPLLQVDLLGTPLSYRTLLNFMKQAVSTMGLDPAVFGTHSLRIGGATQLAMCNFSTSQIQEVGRWTSDCYRRYLRFDDSFFRQVSHALGSSASATASPFGPLTPHQASSANNLVAQRR